MSKASDILNEINPFQKINSNIVLHVLNLLHEVFPVPEGFGGSHGIVLDKDTGRLMVTIWRKVDEEIKSFPVIFDNEPMTKDTFLDIKERLDERIKNNNWEPYVEL